MLSTLLKLGEQLSKNQNEWERIIDSPNVEKEKAKNINLYLAELIFDLDQPRVYVSTLTEYDDGSPLKFKNIRIQGGNNKSIYVCAEAGKLDQIKKTLFGKELASEKGEFIEAIDKDFIFLKTSQLYAALNQVFALKNIFSDFYGHTDEKGKVKSVETVLLEPLGLSQSSKVVLWYASIISAELNINTPTPFNQLPGYDDFVRAKFLDKAKNISSDSKLSYASGKTLVNTTETDFTTRYSINKMFVKETKNYASGFDENNFGKNYQINAEEQVYLESISKRLLDKQQVKIAGIDHCIIPQFLNHSSISVEEVLSRSLKRSELLFQVRTFDQIQTEIKDALFETEEPYWVNFLGFESDGNFFKTMNVIKDVSSLHLTQVIKTFTDVDIQMKRLPGAVNWTAVMTDFVGKERLVSFFNLTTLYYLIPQRKDKEKKNEALGIFKSILERRKVSREKLFSHFCNLILCHYYPTRYEAFKNVRKYQDGDFDFAVRDAVFKYLAFIQVLKHLNLLDFMENIEETDLALTPAEETIPVDMGQYIEHFFQQMNYTPVQRAMFYLGRSLSTIAFAQQAKGYSKPILNQLNYTGMKREAVLKFHGQLSEKAIQHKEAIYKGKTYNIQAMADRDLANFRYFFSFPFSESNKELTPEESLFYILSGYSYGLTIKENKSL